MTREDFILQVEATMEAFRRFLVALCCGDSTRADDIAQDAYVKAYMSCDKLRDPERFKSWIFKIGYNTFLNQKRGERIHGDLDEVRSLTSGVTCDSQFRYQELYLAMNKLSAKERASILLYYMEGYSIKEIAEIEEISKDSVKQHLSRGRLHLKALLS